MNEKDKKITRSSSQDHILKNLSLEEKRAYILIMSLLAYYHGLSSEDKSLLNKETEAINGKQAFFWAKEFIEKNTVTASKRAKAHLKKVKPHIEIKKRVTFLENIWQIYMKKGYLTTTEATTLLKIAKSWGVETDILTQSSK